MLRTLLLTLFFSITFSFHHNLQHFPLAISHKQAQVPQVNEAELKSVEFEQQFTRIKNQEEYIQRTLNLNDSSKFKYIIKKCKEISSGFIALHRSLLKYKLLISPQNLMCPGVSTFNRTEIRRYLSYTEGKEKELSLYYTTCFDCKFIIPEIDKMLDMTHDYFKLINKTLDGDYCKVAVSEKATGLVDLNRSYFKNNLAGGNWYYGSTTKSDYKIKVFKQSVTYNLTNCPSHTPFIRTGETACFNCPQGSLYNLGTEKCTVCGIHQIFNPKKGTCEPCLGSKETVENNVVCRLCVLADLEIYNETTGKCQVCNGNRYLDRGDQLCKQISCTPSAPRFNVETQTCESCGISQVIDPHEPTRCIKTNYIGVCSNQAPYYDYDAHTCTVCPKDASFNKSSNQCQPHVAS